MAEPSTTTRRRGRLTRDAVLRRAVEIADAHGVEALTMRRLAEDLGVEAMSLYHHVDGKDGLLDGVVELVLEEVLDAVGRLEEDESTPPEDWKAAVRARILAARTVMLRHRWAPAVMEQRDRIGLAAARHVDGVVGIMLGAGLPADLVHHALHALGSRLYGFAQELGEPKDDADAEAMAAMVPLVPHLAAMLSQVAHDGPDSTLGWCDDQTEFEFGLDLLLDGLERRARGA